MRYENLKIWKSCLSFFSLGAARPLTQLKSPSNQSYPQQPTIISIVYTPFQRREKKTLDLIWKYLNALQNLQFCAFVTFHNNPAMINIASPVKQSNITLLNVNRPGEWNVEFWGAVKYSWNLPRWLGALSVKAECKVFLSLKSPIDPGNSEKTWMSLKCTLIWMERGLININGRALFALKTCHLAFMSTDKGRTAPILRRMRESFMKVRLLCHIYLLSSSTRHGICVVFIFYLFSSWRPGFVPCSIFLAQYLVENSFLAFLICGILCPQFTVFVFLKSMKWTLCQWTC